MYKSNFVPENNTTTYLPLLSMLYITASLGTFVLAYKMSYICGILISTGIFIFPFTYFFGAIVAEVYKYESGRRLVIYAFICQLLFAVSTYFLVRLPPAPNWHYQSDYEIVLGSVFWFFVSNATGVFIGSFLNVYIITKWKSLVKGKYFITRCITSSLMGEAITSIIADILAFSRHMDVQNLGKLMLAIYVTKIFYSIILAYPAKFICHKLKDIEKVTDLHTPIYLFSNAREINAINKRT